jgi:hypothetical protein
MHILDDKTRREVPPAGYIQVLASSIEFLSPPFLFATSFPFVTFWATDSRAGSLAPLERPWSGGRNLTALGLT